jgi:hypothetical protein
MVLLVDTKYLKEFSNSIFKFCHDDRDSILLLNLTTEKTTTALQPSI